MLSPTFRRVRHVVVSYVAMWRAFYAVRAISAVTSAHENKNSILMNFILIKLILNSKKFRKNPKKSLKIRKFISLKI